MPTLRRILKYTPAVVMGLLIVAWVVSLYGSFGHGINLAQRNGFVGFHNRSFRFSLYSYDFLPDHSSSLTVERIGDYGWLVAIPITLLLTVILPLAIGPFISLRFRLWHYLAYTALVAVELAYYLRWLG